MPRINVKDKRRQQLIEANMASIAKRGYAETTITHIAQGAEMSRGIINFYFTTKETMMRETLKFMVEEYQEFLHETLAAAKSLPAHERLQLWAASHFDRKLCAPRKIAVWAAFWGHATTHPDYQKIIAKCDAAQKEIVMDLWQEAAGGASKDDTQEHVSALLSLIRGLWLSILLRSERDGKEDYQQMLKQFINTHLQPVSKTEKPKLVAAAPKKRKLALPENQLDFGDLFSMKK